MSGPLLLGLVAGLGAWLVLRALAPDRRSLAGDLAALGRPNRSGTIEPGREERLAGTVGRLAPELVRTEALAADLELVGRSEAEHLVQRLRTAAFYGGVPLATWWITKLAGAPIVPAVVAHLLTAAGIALGWLVTDHQLRSTATASRARFGAALVTYLQLVAIQVAGGSGVDEALRTAADYGHDDSFGLLRSCLTDARTRGVSPWVVMADRGERLGLDALVDLASTMELAGLSGAHVRESLMTKARSLRLHQINEAERSADTRTTAMAGPTSFMAGGFVVLIGYPAFTVILGL